MRTYPFAPIAAREYPTIALLDNPYIWGGVRFCVNVSEKPYPVELAKALADHGIDWIYCPISEEPGAQWLDALMTALPRMLYAYKTGLKQVVHCDFGNNRSRSFVEALYYCLHNEHFQDEYKGEINHYVYNCTIKHLPPLADTEEVIRNIGSSSQ